MLEPAAHEILGDGGSFDVIALETPFSRLPARSPLEDSRGPL